MDLLFKSPAHAVANHPHFFKQEDDNDPKYSIGSASHSLFLEGIDKACVVDADDWRKKEAKEQREQAYIDGKIPLLTKQYEEVHDMVATANKALGESELATTIKDGEPERSHFWQESGIWLKTRPDWLNVDIILDYKTSDSANPEDFGRKAVSLGYDVQESLYKRGFKALYGVEPVFVFMVQEIKFPYLCSFISLSPEFQAMGNAKVNQAIDLWRHCLRTEEWPGYPKRIAYVDAPPWSLGWQMSANMADGEQL
jgi:hypothetical protein